MVALHFRSKAMSICGSFVALCLFYVSATAQADEKRAAEVWSLLRPAFTPPVQYRDDMGHYHSLLEHPDGRPVTDAKDWPRRRQEILDEWQGLLGPWPDLLEKPQIKYLKAEHRENFTQHQVHVEIHAGGKYTEGYL